MTEANNAASLSSLSEVCVSKILPKILSMTSPRDACRAASISKRFNLVADSDDVWHEFLPPDYIKLIDRAISPVVYDSKKQLYHLLADSYILLDRGYLGLKLDKESGKKCYILGKSYLYIAWEADARYWNWGRVPQARFAKVAILRHVWWLEITGNIKFGTLLSPKTTYVAYLVYRITRNASGLTKPGTIVFSCSWGRNEISNVCLQQHRERAQVQVQEHEHAPFTRSDGWMEIKVGEFYYDNANECQIYMSFREYYSYKSGLIVEGMEVRPKTKGCGAPRELNE